MRIVVVIWIYYYSQNRLCIISQLIKTNSEFRLIDTPQEVPAPDMEQSTPAPEQTVSSEETEKPTSKPEQWTYMLSFLFR